MEPGSTSVVVYAAARFHDPNPNLYAATAQAFEDAIDWISSHPHEAAEIYVGREPQKKGVDWVERITRHHPLQRDTARHADPRRFHARCRNTEEQGSKLEGFVLGEYGNQGWQLAPAAVIAPNPVSAR
jgi:hypothetical protein